MSFIFNVLKLKPVGFCQLVDVRTMNLDIECSGKGASITITAEQTGKKKDQLKFIEKNIKKSAARADEVIKIQF